MTIRLVHRHAQPLALSKPANSFADGVFHIGPHEMDCWKIGHDFMITRAVFAPWLAKKFRTGRLVEPLYLFDYVAPQGAPLCIYPMQLRSLCVTERLGTA